tara:strand:+ start:4339 stop:5412 length:1074 start_codon:yes stop_codon:yes gene_type:complete
MSKNVMPPRITQRDGTYYASYHDGERGRRVSLRTDDSKIAVTRFEGWLKERRLQTDGDPDPLIADCLDYWFEQWISGRMLSENRYPSIIKHLKKAFGRMRVSQVNRTHSRQYIEDRRTGKYGRCIAADSTIRKELQSLRAALNFMSDRIEPVSFRLLKEKLPYIELPPPSPPRDRVLDDVEIDAIFNYVDNLKVDGQFRRATNRLPKLTRFVYLAHYTWQRKSAILQLRWSQVNDLYSERATINFLPGGRLQTAKRRPMLPIDDKLLTVLRRAFEERTNDFVCDTKSDIHYAVKKMGFDLDIDGLSPHVWRHTGATHAAMDGVPMDQIAAFMGDTVQTVEKNYKHLSPEYLRNVINR